MRFRLTPSDTSFYDLFSGAAANLVTGAQLLKDMLAATPAERDALAARMREVEHSGDELTHQVMRQLNSSFITPFDREDISRLASNLDDVMDYLDAAMDLVVLYRLEALPAEVARQVELLERAAELTAAAMPRLRAMNGLTEYWIEVNRLENEADRTYRQLLARLFSGEFEALTVLKLKDVVDQLEAAADAFEHVAHTVETIAAKES